MDERRKRKISPTSKKSSNDVIKKRKTSLFLKKSDEVTVSNNPSKSGVCEEFLDNSSSFDEITHKNDCSPNAEKEPTFNKNAHEQKQPALSAKSNISFNQNICDIPALQNCEVKLHRVSVDIGKYKDAKACEIKPSVGVKSSECSELKENFSPNTNEICAKNEAIVNSERDQLCSPIKNIKKSIDVSKTLDKTIDDVVPPDTDEDVTSDLETSDGSPDETVQEENESYEMKVNRQRRENQEFLKSLGIYNKMSPTLIQSTSSKGKAASEARKGVTKSHQSSATFMLTPTRRSSRLKGKDPQKHNPIISVRQSRIVQKRENFFGPVPGVAVGTEFDTRMEASHAGVHRPPVSGIHGNAAVGCYSIALSGGYEDDVDSGSSFVYTGEGGRDLKGTKTNPKNLRTAPQSKDQVLERGNLALAKNCEENIPVRVLRGYKLRSEFAPESGYRYDGLYKVDKYFLATGASGFKVYKFIFSRLDNQEPAPWMDKQNDSHNIEEPDDIESSHQKNEQSPEQVSGEQSTELLEDQGSSEQKKGDNHDIEEPDDIESSHQKNDQLPQQVNGEQSTEPLEDQGSSEQKKE